MILNNKIKITVFGHTGFIGRNIVLKLSKKKILPKAVCTKYPLLWEKVEKCKWN